MPPLRKCLPGSHDFVWQRACAELTLRRPQAVTGAPVVHLAGLAVRLPADDALGSHVQAEAVPAGAPPRAARARPLRFCQHTFQYYHNSVGYAASAVTLCGGECGGGAAAAAASPERPCWPSAHRITV